MSALEECDTIMTIKRTLETLPAGLDNLYARAIERIVHSKHERAKIGLLALLWVVHAERPLSLRELQQLLATQYTVGSFELGTFIPDGLPEENIIFASTCGLLTLDASGRVRLTRESRSAIQAVHHISDD